MTTSEETRSSLKHWLLFAALAGVLLLILLMRPMGNDARSHPAVGQQLESINLQPMTENAQPIRTGDLEGKITVINLWGTWCKPCRLEFPHLAAIEKRFRERPNFQFLAVSCESEPGSVTEEELREATQEFLASRESDLPAYADLDLSFRMELSRATGWNGGYPTTVVLDGGRTVRGMWEGYKPGAEKELEALVEELVGK